MKILFIGGTGNISSAVSQQLVALGHELWLLNRSGNAGIHGAQTMRGDIHDPTSLTQLNHHNWDAVKLDCIYPGGYSAGCSPISQ